MCVCAAMSGGMELIALTAAAVQPLLETAVDTEPPMPHTEDGMIDVTNVPVSVKRLC